ncbi:uncharacterized protein B0J16DRAFT_339976 [Fusarium flagelliforme]|uniref:uncharacterized protein n=1 Tax=Fusarium flagelliforme TaxID=2675880 RepID=UPI001E8CFD7D|nr:uncharacterized protein B0J16DRAFT_339976 [Fusarium flagelliforme]KAH7189632.1 hypothetical protein B0J16DRAFT_339976 [Fusarium flagelliforme]
MKPLSSPVTRDLEHEVVCDFNVDDALPVGRYMPEISCSQGERPRYSHPTKLPFQLDPLDIPPKFGFGWLFNALVRNIKAANPDFRFDNIDIIAHAGTLACCSMYFNNITPENARELGQIRLQLWGNTLFLYNEEEIKSGRIDGLHNAILLTITSKDWRRPFRAVRYNFGGLNCLVVFPYEVRCPDPSTVTATDEGNSVPENAQKGKAMIKPDDNTENSIAKYTASILTHKYGDEIHNSRMLSREVPFDWFTRLDYHVCAVLKSNINSTWLRAIRFDSADARCEVYESARRGQKDYIHDFAGILRWLRESMIKRTSTTFCSMETVESEEGTSLRL